MKSSNGDLHDNEVDCLYYLKKTDNSFLNTRLLDQMALNLKNVNKCFI